MSAYFSFSPLVCHQPALDLHPRRRARNPPPPPGALLISLGRAEEMRTAGRPARPFLMPATMPAKPRSQTHPRWNLKRDFHAVGDGRADDTQALVNQFNRSRAGSCSFPKHLRYSKRNRHYERKRDPARRRSRPNDPALSKSLEDLFGNKPNNDQSQWAFRPGLINVTAKIRNQRRHAPGHGHRRPPKRATAPCNSQIQFSKAW